jgi:hypothetical protein
MTISLRIQERTRSAIVELVFSVNCDRIKLPRVSWHSFRHTHATLLAEVGESIKTAVVLGTTLNSLNGDTASCRTRCDGCYRQKLLHTNQKDSGNNHSVSPGAQLLPFASSLFLALLLNSH